MVDSGTKKRLKVLEETFKVTGYAATCVHIEHNKKIGFQKENMKLCNTQVLN
jgi:hypothetical protein